jgi:hypothetical protein
MQGKGASEPQDLQAAIPAIPALSGQGSLSGPLPLLSVH